MGPLAVQATIDTNATRKAHGEPMAWDAVWAKRRKNSRPSKERLRLDFGEELIDTLGLYRSSVVPLAHESREGASAFHPPRASCAHADESRGGRWRKHHAAVDLAAAVRHAHGLARQPSGPMGPRHGQREARSRPGNRRSA